MTVIIKNLSDTAITGVSTIASVSRGGDTTPDTTKTCAAGSELTFSCKSIVGQLQYYFATLDVFYENDKYEELRINVKKLPGPARVDFYKNGVGQYCLRQTE
jgi:hypothetical protein